MNTINKIMKKLSRSSDEKRLKNAFKGVNEDITLMNKNHEDLKLNVHEWISHLDAQNKMLLEKIEHLEKTKAHKVIEL